MEVDNQTIHSTFQEYFWYCSNLQNIVFFCIVNNQGIEEWIVQIKNKLARRINKGEIENHSESQEERAGMIDICFKKNLAREDAPIANN